MRVKIKASPAPPCQNKPSWHGCYWHEGRWHIVCNRDGDPIVYATPEAANAAAWLQAPAQPEELANDPAQDMG
jgi:hypothetical protein